MSPSTGDLMAALRREIDACVMAKAREPKQIRINPGVPAGSMVSMPVTDDTEIGRTRAILGIVPDYEVLIHPVDWYRLMEGISLSTIESNMRQDGATEDEIEVMKANAYANPQDFRFFGIPVVDDVPKVL